MNQRKSESKNASRRARIFFFRSEEMTSLLGDLDELYPGILTERGRFPALIWLLSQILGSLFHLSLKSLKWNIIMLGNYLKLTLRGIRRRKVHSAVNILGLAAGLACCILIYLFIADELSFDDFHRERDTLHRLVRILYSNADGSERLRDPSIQPAVGPLLKASYPEIEYQTRWMEWNGVVSYASGLAVLIAGIGIFGLTALRLSRRVREIGIRKVLGAGAARILRLVLGEFVLLVTAANLVSWPVIYLVMRGILQNYAYRVGIGAHHFFLAGGLSLAVAVLTVTGLALRAASADPVKSLRHE
jgi:hypothetical protein